MKVVCVTSSASLGFRTSASANRYTSRTYRRYMRSKARSSTTLVAAIYPARTPLRPLRIWLWPLAQAGAAARGLRFGMWIARPSATRPASLIASESVGCGAMPSATVSTVDSASIATTPASTRSVTCGPTITRPRSSPYRVSWIDFTQPTVSSCMTARAFAIHGNWPTATSSPYSSRAPPSVGPHAVVPVPLAGLRLGEADGRDLRLGVDRARHGADVRGGLVPARVLRCDLAL